MKSEIAELWAQALEGGSFPQLDRNTAMCRVGPDGVERYCAHGVLCELASRAGVVEKYQGTDKSTAGFRNKQGTPFGKRVILFWFPTDVDRWAGFQTNKQGKIAWQSLLAAAGYKNFAFPEIAKLVRELAPVL